MKRLRTIFLFLSALAAARAASAQLDVHLSTSKAGGGRIPIAVRDFRLERADLRSASDYIVGVLLDDLEFTDAFAPVRLQGGADSLAGGAAAAALVEGSLGWDGSRYALSVSLLDFVSRETIFGKRYLFEHDAMRAIAHDLSDEILFFLIGEIGVAKTRILFTRREGEVKNLYLVDYDGHGERRLTEGELVVSPVWLDWSRFCFTSYRRDNPDCYLMDLARGKRLMISSRVGINVAGGFNPASDELVMTLSLAGNSEIYLMSPGGELGRRLTSNRAIDVSPVWSPNGREIAFVSDRYRSPQIFLMDRYGGNARRLTSEGSYNTAPAWSPKGDLIAYAAREGGVYRLRLISPDGLYRETVFDDAVSCEDPSWAPDGRHLAVTARFGGEPWILVVDIDTGSRRRLVRGEAAAWSPLPPEK
ncbi:MAG: Tol-Pal system beta propeller repeat protein TolB [Candidatus Krumholzibacteria bacterium]|nr:Tol-Pal system beta propeller repeat protein TolB [Candidatus Krumholzibacteria bacterium]